MRKIIQIISFIVIFYSCNTDPSTIYLKIYEVDSSNNKTFRSAPTLLGLYSNKSVIYHLNTFLFQNLEESNLAEQVFERKGNKFSSKQDDLIVFEVLDNNRIILIEENKRYLFTKVEKYKMANRIKEIEKIIQNKNVEFDGKNIKFTQKHYKSEDMFQNEPYYFCSFEGEAFLVMQNVYLEPLQVVDFNEKGILLNHITKGNLKINFLD